MTISSDQFSAATWAICTCLVSVKDNKLERLLQQYASLGLAIIQRPARATKELRARRDENRVAQSCSLVVYADSDVVPAVRCQQGGWRVVRFSAWVWDIVWREKKQKCVCICVCHMCVCVCVCTCLPVLFGMSKALKQDEWLLLKSSSGSCKFYKQSPYISVTHYCHRWPICSTLVLFGQKCQAQGKPNFGSELQLQFRNNVSMLYFIVIAFCCTKQSLY